jgi:Tol biopolymer transport system component
VRPGPLDDVPLDYSPNGQQLVFYRSAHPDPDPHTDGSLWVVNVDGSDLHRITKSTRPPADSARWSPDGKRILFADQRTASTGAVWTVAPDGSHLTKVFSDKQGRFPIDPLWSPDGTHILFALDPTNDAFTHPKNGLYTSTAEGTQLRLVVGTQDFKAPSDWWR